MSHYIPSALGFQVEHPDRVAWYDALILEWTTQTPAVMSCAVERADGSSYAGFMAWVGPYHSQAGTIHAAGTYAVATTVELAVEQLANDLYSALQTDLLYLYQHSVSSVGR